MLSVRSLEDLLLHMEWADAEVWATVLASESVRKDAKVREYLYHLHLVQRAFLRVWRGEPRETPYPAFEDAESMMVWGRSCYAGALAHVGNLTDETASEPQPVPWATMVENRLGRAPESTSAGETILQVVLHSMYHRGQINARIRELGGEPRLVDYIAWVWLGRPAAEWPSAGEPS